MAEKNQTDRVYQGDSGVTVKWTQYDEDRFNAARRRFHYQEEHPVRSILSDRGEAASLAWDAVLLLGVAVFAWYVYHAISVVYRDASINSAVVHLFAVVGAAGVLTVLLRYRCPVLSVVILPATFIAIMLSALVSIFIS